MPVVRTFANPVAGMSKMDTRTFALYNVGGAALWTFGVILLGYFIGDSVKDTYLIPTVIVVSVIPVVFEVVRAPAVSRGERGPRAARTGLRRLRAARLRAWP